MNKTAVPSQEWKVSWVSLFRCVLAIVELKSKRFENEGEGIVLEMMGRKKQ